MTKIPSTLTSWLRSARQTAGTYRYHATRRAVEETPLSPEEHEAAYRLYTEHERTIRHICAQALSKARRSPAARLLSVEDLMQEAYVLFLRCLIGYDREKGSLGTYLLHALRRRVVVHLRSMSVRDVPSSSGTDADPVTERAPSDIRPLPLDWLALVERMLRSGRLGEPTLIGPRDAVVVWRRAKAAS